MKKALTAVAVIALLQSACSASPKANPRFVIGKPYTEEGKTYFPTLQPNYKEIGVASWYGPGFHNRLTANGEVFNQNLMTAAHRTLPLPSIAKVTNLENGRSIYVRINDRGPFTKSRIIDLSKQAAAELGMMSRGQAKVLVELEKTASAAALNSVKISEAEKKYVLSQLQVVTGEEATAFSSPESTIQQVTTKLSSTEDQDISPNQITVSEVEQEDLTIIDKPEQSEISNKTAANKPNFIAANQAKMQNKTAANKIADLSGSVMPKSIEMKNVISSNSISKQDSVNYQPLIKTKILPKISNPTLAKGFQIQLQASSTREKAEKILNSVANKFSGNIEEVNINGKTLFRVRVGGFKSLLEAKQAKNTLNNIGYNDSFIIAPN